MFSQRDCAMQVGEVVEVVEVEVVVVLPKRFCLAGAVEVERLCCASAARAPPLLLHQRARALPAWLLLIKCIGARIDKQ